MNQRIQMKSTLVALLIGLQKKNKQFPHFRFPLGRRALRIALYRHHYSRINEEIVQ